MDNKTAEATRLWTLAQPTISAFVTSLVREIHDRDDILQEVAVAVMESFGTYDHSRPFVAWAIGIARNQVGLYFRRRGRERLVFDPQAMEQLEQAFAEIRPRDVRILDHLEECIQSLQNRARNLCRLRYEHDLKPLAIAPRVGMSANGVAKALQRTRELLRECVEKKAILDGIAS
ncbi:MAG: sigma-70 family RNA polymerase sigma factor [Isosphaeraceae bacterium]|nr:sigma-70 family RNA polymerase sigma factor [Isosphaeraceae bacterium]